MEKLCIACYFRPEKYSCDEVREFYDGLILNLVEGLGIEGYQAHNFEGLLKLQRTYELTHVFIAQAEYEENKEYYEKLAGTLRVVVIAEKEYLLSEESKLLIIHKPFSALVVANLLNGEIGKNGFEEAQAAGHRPFTCERVRALVVDDEEMNLVVTKGVLGSYGIEVDTCLSGMEAVERCTDNYYDVVFLDHMMPGFDGVETLKYIREINEGMYEDLPVIALTANTISGAREMFRIEGFTEFIPKPIERTVLERILRKVLPKDRVRYGVVESADTRSEEESVQIEEMKKAEIPAQVDEEIPAQVDEEIPVGSVLPYDRLTQAGINVQIGLDYCCGEEDFYLEMLRMFYSQSEAKRDEIVALYTDANWKDYAIKVHALKSTSLTIGAEELSKQAKELELAGKKQDVGYIQDNHSVLLRMYEEVCESIAGV